MQAQPQGDPQEHTEVVSQMMRQRVDNLTHLKNSLGNKQPAKQNKMLKKAMISDIMAVAEVIGTAPIEEALMKTLLKLSNVDLNDDDDEEEEKKHAATVDSSTPNGSTSMENLLSEPRTLII